ncbi:transcriptional regulator [Rhodococcoides trifolii]|uniref:Transcriptional regulator n=1 Tax=Rhodococcoides trifolii TaxID=908250 RepID=A0A917CRA6_9NOCA|nr:transcriptional regulator [Rhodococcus trifolii]
MVRVRDALPGLQPAERRVADAVLADPSASSELSITMLATRATTSETTVMRFCRTLGLTSYPQLRLALAAAAAREAVWGGPGEGDIDVSDTLSKVVDKIVHSETLALEDTRAGLDIEALQRAVDAIAGARRIDVIGSGASGFVAADLQQKLHRIGLVSFVWSDIHAALTGAALLDARDVAIGISHSGATLDTIDPLTAARSRGATTIALTNFSGSPIADDADILLTTAARETTFRSGATASRIAQLAVIDALFIGVVQSRFDDASVKLADTYRAVQPRRR